MSPRAAWRLEAFGFSRVYDYVGGKLDWLAHGLPTEGMGPHHAVAGEAVTSATATCLPTTPSGHIRRDLQPGWDSLCAVTNEEGIVVGRVRWKDLPESDDVPAGDFMQLGPATVRPSEQLAPLVERMRHAGVKTIIVTTADGRLVGMVHRDEAERALANRTPT